MLYNKRNKKNKKENHWFIYGLHSFLCLENGYKKVKKKESQRKNQNCCGFSKWKEKQQEQPKGISG